MADNTALEGAAQATPSSQMLAVGGGEIHLQRAGEGPPLLILHGAGGAGIWMPHHAMLAQHFDVVAPDHPGFGRSPLLRDVRDVEDLVYHYLEVLDRLELDRVVLVGESFGGWISAELAAHSPHRVEKLVLLAAPGLRIPGEMPFDVFLARPDEMVSRLLHNQELAAHMFPAEPTVEDIVGAYTEQSAFAQYAFSPFLNNRKLERRLHRITAGTLVVWGDDDRIVPMVHGERYAAGIPDASLHIVEQCGHAISAEQPEAVAAAITTFASA